MPPQDVYDTLRIAIDLLAGYAKDEYLGDDVRHHASVSATTLGLKVSAEVVADAVRTVIGPIEHICHGGNVRQRMISTWSMFDRDREDQFIKYVTFQHFPYVDFVEALEGSGLGVKHRGDWQETCSELSNIMRERCAHDVGITFVP